MQTAQILSILISLGLLALVLDFVRRGLLKEKYSVLWLASIFTVLVLALWKGLLLKLATLVGVAYPPTLLFIVSFVFIVLLLLHFSVVISILTEKNKTLAQEFAILKESVERGERESQREEGNG